MTPNITAFERSPDRGRRLARDMRIRWALEEAGQPYDVRRPAYKRAFDDQLAVFTGKQPTG
jgi:glutathione S-transferase